MTELTTNLLSAFAVSTIISVMAKIQSQKLKAILYALPFPITIALIGSNSIATSLSISGLAVTGGFLWGCYYLHGKRGLNVLLVDVLLAVAYVVVAYVLAHNLDVSFWAMLAAYITGWVVLMTLFSSKTFTYTKRLPAKTNGYLKAGIIFVIAFGLFSTHQYLAAFVVTFPYIGVFAVYENRLGLLPQAALFTRNSLALVAYFVTNYLVGTQQPAVVRYAASWTAFGLVLVAVNTLVKIKIEDAQTSSQGGRTTVLVNSVR